MLAHFDQVKAYGKRAERKVRRLLSAAVGRDAVTGRKVERTRKILTLGSRLGQWSIPASLLDQNSTVYCVGCGENITFDIALIERFGCAVHAFDPTPRAIVHVAKVTKNVPQYVFQPIGLWDSDQTLSFFAPSNEAYVSHSAVNLQRTNTKFDAPVRRLSNIMRDLGHNKLDLLKLDIEGAEYRVLESILEDKLQITVLCVEFDEFFHPIDDGYVSRIDRHIERLLDHGYRLLHASGTANYTFAYQPGT